MGTLRIRRKLEVYRHWHRFRRLWCRPLRNLVPIGWLNPIQQLYLRRCTLSHLHRLWSSCELHILERHRTLRFNRSVCSHELHSISGHDKCLIQILVQPQPQLNLIRISYDVTLHFLGHYLILQSQALY
jgi:hypothetical protein